MKIENDIRRFLLRNALVVYATSAIALGSVVFAVLFAHRVSTESRKIVYMINDQGEVLPLKEVDSKENDIIEIKHHLVMFVDYYYSLNQFNWEKKTEKALWLGNFQADFKNKYATGYYTNLVQYGVERVAELDPQQIELFPVGEHAGFKIQIRLVEKVANQERAFMIFGQGTVRKIDRNFPYNPHGMYIENYLEEKKIEIK